MRPQVSPGGTQLTPDNFESFLASDEVLTNYFNDFLRLPSFSENLLYHQDSGQVQVLNKCQEHNKSQFLTNDLTWTPPVDDHHIVCCHDEEQGMQWLKRERLTFFLQSDYYFQYRLAKLLLQQDPLFKCQRRECTSSPTSCSASQLQYHYQQNIMTSSHSHERTSEKRGVVNMVHGQSRLTTVRIPSAEEAREQASEKKDEDDSGGGRRTEREEKPRVMGSRLTHQKTALNVSRCGICCFSRKEGMDEFRRFLRGTAGESIFYLWMDIERLKATRHSELKARTLHLMMSCYLDQSSSRAVNMVLLSDMGLSTSPCWTEKQLQSVQPKLTECLLYYWAPHFCSFKSVPNDCPDVGLRRNICGCGCLSGVHPSFTSTLQDHVHPGFCLPHFQQRLEQLSRRRHLISGTGTERLVQALSVESCSGMYFTHFCQQSGNQLWVNTVYFWTDLQHYHQLFHQDGSNLYAIQGEAQLLYSTYISSFARRSISVDVEVQRSVYDRLLPISQMIQRAVESRQPIIQLLFEGIGKQAYIRLLLTTQELFDDAEEHALSILLDPWTMLINQDNRLFQQVFAREVVTYIDSQEYEEPQKPCEVPEEDLRQESWQLPSAMTPSTPDYQDHGLCSILQNHDLKLFTSFLEKQNARIHLMCYLDLEQYKGTSEKDGDIRQQRSSQIAAKYLNENYFFGPDSPATAEQQNNVLCLAGGLERLKLECVSNPVAVEIQNIVRSLLEETWLPAFLSTEALTEQQHKEKAQGSQTSGPEEILLQQVLLNPDSCQKFELFVSSKGEFLENDARFWVEVQKYKDLFHSHCDEGVLQNKISVLIDCFIHTCMSPPLRIDVPPDQVQRILEKRYEVDPYIFREAQMSVFDKLLRFWPEFQELSSSLSDEQLLALLQRKQQQYRAKRRRQKSKEEEIAAMRITLEELERRLEEDETDQDDLKRKEKRQNSSKAQGSHTNSPDEILLRQVLLNPTSCLKFELFVSSKGEFLENDARFWVEVQKYKDLFHSHCDEVVLQNKISVLIDCFIHTCMSPALRIDVPPGQVQRILEKRYEVDPYIFREAQMSVFDKLLRFWPEFQELSSSLSDEQLLALLQRKQQQYRAKKRRQKSKEEEIAAMRITLEELERQLEEDETEEEMEESTSKVLWASSKDMADVEQKEKLLRKQTSSAKHQHLPTANS
ncbi:regulator of G-protein signaling 22 isoform X2 [Nothobranchius furzeri]|uniref:regulator of G-protein signaling 22 isoform X2 n=1 Tax=Nothobranchius furzeri TaxID=105023 RepID=UPI003904BA02